MEEKTQIQVSNEDLDKIKNLEKSYQEITIEYGQLMIDKLNTEKHLNEICKQEEQLKLKYTNLETIEEELGSYLTKLYGSGQLNIETGVFIQNTK